MSAQLWGAFVDNFISIAAGILASLYGYKVMGYRTGTPRYDQWYETWGKHLKWLGPLVIAFGLLRMLITVVGS